MMSICRYVEYIQLEHRSRSKYFIILNHYLFIEHQSPKNIEKSLKTVKSSLPFSFINASKCRKPDYPVIDNYKGHTWISKYREGL